MIMAITLVLITLIICLTTIVICYIKHLYKGNINQYMLERVEKRQFEISTSLLELVEMLKEKNNEL